MTDDWTPRTPVPSPKEVNEAKTPAGGYTANTLKEWGVPWPAPKGWRTRLAQMWKAEHPDEQQTVERAFVKSTSPCSKNGNKIHPWTEVTTENNKVRVFRCTKCGARTTRPMKKD